MNEWMNASAHPHFTRGPINLNAWAKQTGNFLLLQTANDRLHTLDSKFIDKDIMYSKY